MLLAFEIGAVASAVAAAYGVCYFIAATRLPQTPCVAFAADAIFGIVYYPLVVVLASQSTLALYPDVHSRWHGTTPASRMLAILLVSRMIVHVPFLELKKQIKESKAQRPIFLIHHAIVIVVYLTGLVLGRCHFWGAMNALCETTNVFLTVIELFTSCRKSTRARFEAMHKASTLAFGVAYFLFRLVLFPVLLFWFISDLVAHPDETLRQLGVFELAAYPFATCAIFALSVKWAVPVAEGTWRVLHQLVEKEVKSP
jgi:hypothetical protein